MLSVQGIVVAAALVATAGLTAGCGGGGERQDANEPSGTYRVQVVGASFPKLQGLAETLPFKLTVRNTGDQAVPNLALTVDGFYDPQAQPGDADPARPVWIVNVAPPNGVTAYVNTWAFGPLGAGQERTYTWRVTATEAGTHTLRYRVGAGLDGKARAVTDDDQVPEGAVTVRVTRRPRISTVNPETGAVEHRGE